MLSNKEKKLIRKILALTMLLTILNIFTPFAHATEWFSIPDTRLTWDDNLDWAPSITQAQDGKIWFAWHSSESGVNTDILYKVYNGSPTFPWSPTKKLTTDLGEDRLPAITTTSDGNIWLVWSSNRNENYDIYYKVYDGASWSLADNLTTDPNIDEFPSIMQASNGTIWLSWATNRTGNFDIYYKTSTDNGTTWSSAIQLPNSTAEDDRDPSILETTDGEIWFVWVRNNNIYYKIYNGTEWSPDTPLTNNNPERFNWHPSIMQASNGDIWIAWDSDRISEQTDIYCKVYNGIDWSSDTRLTFNGADDLMPSIMQDRNGTIWIAWTSSRLNNFDIYYKTDSPPQHLYDIAIISVTHDPDITVVYQGLDISIEVVIQNQGMKSKNFVAGAYVNSTLIGNQTKNLSPGQLMPIYFTWNTLNVTNGIYTIIANVSIIGENDTDPIDNIFIDGKVHVKSPGDVNGDGVIDAYDLFDLSKAYGSKRGDPSWNPEADLNRDDKVNSSDLSDLGENYGKIT